MDEQQREAFRTKQTQLTGAFEELLAGFSFTISSEEREMVEHYVEHREFGLAFDILCDVVLPDKTLTNDDRTAMRRIGLQMGPIDEANFRLLPWLADKE